MDCIERNVAHLKPYWFRAGQPREAVGTSSSLLICMRPPITRGTRDGDMLVHVRQLAGPLGTILLPSHSTTLTLKCAIKERWGINKRCQRLLTPGGHIIQPSRPLRTMLEDLTQPLEVLVLHVSKACQACGREGPVQICSGCHETSYCSRDCQVLDWPAHRIVCARLERDTGQACPPP